MNRKRVILLGALCCLATSPCWANDFMFSVAAAPVVALALVGWLLVGVAIRVSAGDVVLAGPGAVLAVVIAILLFFHLELIMMIWIIYLGLLVAYFAFGAKDIPAEARRANLLFHGIFLGVVVVGGIVAKILYWHRQGGFAAWAEWMKEIYPAFLIPFVIITLIVFVFVRRAGRKKASEN